MGQYAQERLVHPGDPEEFELGGQQGEEGMGMGGGDMSWEDAGAAVQVQAEEMRRAEAMEVERQVQAQQAQRQQQIEDQRRAATAQAQAASQAAAAAQAEQDARSLDPASASETRKISVTPSIAQESGGPLLPSAIMARAEDDRKRTREEIEALEEAARKKTRSTVISPSPSQSQSPSSPSSSSTSRGPAKLTKDRPSASASDDEGKKGKSGLLSKFFGGGRKDRHKEKGTSGSISDSGHGGAGSGEGGLGVGIGRPSDDSGSGRSGSVQSHTPTPTTTSSATGPGVVAVQGSAQSPASQHAQQLRNRDQEQMALYQQYLNRSPASPPEVQPSYGLMSASTVMGTTSSSSSSSMLSPLSAETQGGLGVGGGGYGGGAGAGGRKPRPGSLLIGPGALDGPPVPELSVIRVFAGTKLQTEATFKTVLLNIQTTSTELIRQAMQRFRLPQGEDPSSYYLTIKQNFEGSFVVLKGEERPLGVFEGLVERSEIFMGEVPRVKRSSVGSISSIASNLSMHPAIRKLGMNDFTDDSAVKFYLNRRGDEDEDHSISMGGEEDLTITAESVADESIGGGAGGGGGSGGLLTVGTAGMGQDRFMSPSVRFALKLLIYPGDLPEDMVFDPVTEAIVFKNTLRDRAPSSHIQQSSTSSSSGQQGGIGGGGGQAAFRRKIFLFPKNVTVAEVIEIGLERFGISEGVVDGGDEVEDKSTKRRSSSRVRYVLKVSVDGKGTFPSSLLFNHQRYTDMGLF